jgi:hypothetical protein
MAEARAFDRRRLVTAFLCGAPAGEAEPPQPGRGIVTGAALALLLIAGSLIAAARDPRPPTDWDRPGLVISEQTGERYLITQEGGALRPVINVASAQLVLGAHLTPRIVSQEALGGRTRGDDIGILGAPEQLPSEGSFVESGWTACTADGAGLSVAVAREPAVSALAGAGATVTADGVTFWVVAEDADHRARRYLIPSIAGADDVLEAVGLLPEARAVRVPASWLALFPVGGALGLDSFALGARTGQTVSYAGRGGIAPTARVGDIATAVGTGRRFLLTADGPAPLDPFAAAIYTTAAELVGEGPREAGTGRPLGVAQVAPTWATAHWPMTTLRPADGPICGRLVTASGAAPYVRLAGDPHGIAWTSPGAGQRAAAADPGVGALVRSGAWGEETGRRSWIVDDRAKAYPIADGETLTALGFDDYRAPLVPDAWIEALGAGVLLSSALALCPPAPEPAAAGTGGCSEAASR